jgi:hypothetical protein
MVSSDRKTGLSPMFSTPLFRAICGVAAGSVLTFFACQVYLAIKVPLPLRVGVLATIVVVGVAGILALLQNDEEPAPTERLYTSAEVREILEAVRAGRFTLASDDACKFCNGAGPEAIGVDGLRYHRSCFQEAFAVGKT